MGEHLNNLILEDLIKKWERDREILSGKAVICNQYERNIIAGWVQCYGQCIVDLRKLIE